MVRTLFRASLITVSVALAACGVPEIVKPYRIDIQQGNYITQEQVSQLRVGMTREQVRFVLGTPLVTDVFHADRWDYVFYRKLRGGGEEQRRMAVIFEQDKLVRVIGDVVPAAPRQAAPAPEPEKNAQTQSEPAKKPESGFFGTILEKLGF